MTFTRRIAPKKAPFEKSGQEAFLATCGGEEISRSARVEELRQLVAAGDYQVKPAVVAERMLRRALGIRQA